MSFFNHQPPHIYIYPLKQFLISNLIRQYGCNQHGKREGKDGS